MNTNDGTATNPETRTAQWLTGCAEKSWSNLKKVLDMWGHMVYIGLRDEGTHPAKHSRRGGTEAQTEGRKDRTP